MSMIVACARACARLARARFSVPVNFQMEIPVVKKLVPLLGLMLLAGPVMTLAAPSSSTGATATHAMKKTHKHSHHKKSSKPAQTKS